MTIIKNFIPVNNVLSICHQGFTFFGSVAKLVHKNRAGQENCQNSFQSKL